MELWQMMNKYQTLPLLAAVSLLSEFQAVLKKKRQLQYDTHEYLLHDSQCWTNDNQKNSIFIKHLGCTIKYSFTSQYI